MEQQERVPTVICMKVRLYFDFLFLQKDVLGTIKPGKYCNSIAKPNPISEFTETCSFVTSSASGLNSLFLLFVDKVEWNLLSYKSCCCYFYIGNKAASLKGIFLPCPFKCAQMKLLCNTPCFI